MASDGRLAYCSPLDKALEEVGPFKPVSDHEYSGVQENGTENYESGGEDAVLEDIDVRGIHPHSRNDDGQLAFSAEIQVPSDAKDDDKILGRTGEDSCHYTREVRCK